MQDNSRQTSVIEVHFQEAMRLSGELGRLSEGLKLKSESVLMQNIYAIKGAWHSANADVFLGKEVKIVSGVQEVTGSMKELADDLSSHAQKVYQIEKRNQMLAGTRFY